MAPTPVFLFCTALLISLKAAAQLHLRPLADSNTQKINLRVLPQNFYTNHMGFVCKKEAQLQKTLSLPLFFRLGNKEYVDRLERKPQFYTGRTD